MSERYGSPAELKEAFEALEKWLREELDRLDCRMFREWSRTHRHGYIAGRVDALRDVLDQMIVNP